MAPRKMHKAEAGVHMMHDVQPASEACLQRQGRNKGGSPILAAGSGSYLPAGSVYKDKGGEPHTESCCDVSPGCHTHRRILGHQLLGSQEVD